MGEIDIAAIFGTKNRPIGMHQISIKILKKINVNYRLDFVH